jgi:rare lipoprotein A
MENHPHTRENRSLGLLPEVEWVRLKTQRVPVEIAPGWVVYETVNHVDQTGLRPGQKCKLRTLLFLVLACCLSTALSAQTSASTDAGQASAKTVHHAGLDRSGKTRKGKASYYGRKFYTKKMADGTPMDPQSNAAASKTLPLGTKARVTNLENGSSEVVEIRDRGPYVKSRSQAGGSSAVRRQCEAGHRRSGNPARQVDGRLSRILIYGCSINGRGVDSAAVN